METMLGNPAWPCGPDQACRGDGQARVEFDASLAAIDGRSLVAHASRPNPVQIGPIDIGGDLFRAIATRAARPMFVALQRSGLAWRATLFASDASGALAAKLGPLPLERDLRPASGRMTKVIRMVRRCIRRLAEGECASSPD